MENKKLKNIMKKFDRCFEFLPPLSTQHYDCCCCLAAFSVYYFNCIISTAGGVLGVVVFLSYSHPSLLDPPLSLPASLSLI